MGEGTGGGGPRGRGSRAAVRTGVAAAMLLGSCALGGEYVAALSRTRGVQVTGATPYRGAAGDGGSSTAGASGAKEADADLTTAMNGVRTGGAKVSVAALDTTTGTAAVYGDDAYDAAGVAKVDILATLLIQAQDDGSRLTAQQRGYASAMIERSDNAAATALWDTIGRADGLNAANGQLGMTGTQGGTGAMWTLTRTTAADQLALLEAVFGDNSVLDAASQSYLRDLMRHGPSGAAAADRGWGVSAAADDASAGALRNGQLERSTTRLWDTNSIGEVTSGGHKVLIAVLSGGSASQSDGITLVNNAARAAVRAVLTA